jgi:hypothetical protein
MNSTRILAGALTLTAAVVLSGCGGNDRDAENERTAEMAVVSAGTKFTVTLDEPLSTRNESEGSAFEATLAEPVVVSGREAIAAGTKVRGEVIQSVGGDEPGGPMLSLVVNGIVDEAGGTQPIETAPLQFEGAIQVPRPDGAPGGGLVPRRMGNGDEAATNDDEYASRTMDTPTIQKPVPLSVDNEIELAAGHDLLVEVVRPTEIVIGLAQLGSVHDNY